MEGTRHWRNVVVLWLIASVIMTPIVIFVIGPGLPPGNGSVQASGQVTDNTVLLATATPVALAVLVYLGYVLWAFRERTPEVVVDGPPIRGNSSVQFWWLIVTTTLVLFLAGYGTVRLLADGSGGGQGPNPIAVPATPAGGKRLVVQVVAQQWQFNYRFPGYGGVETNQIELPENTLIQFNVTSLDVVHSFNFYALGVKADAVPLNDNVVTATPTQIGTYRVQCTELCGLWHGNMADNTAMVVSTSDFAAWIQQQTALDAPIMKYLLPYSHTYEPQPAIYGS